MKTLKLLMIILFISGCSTTVHDIQVCSPIPGNQGAVCDNLLEEDPKILSQNEWEDLQSEWNSEGKAVECVNSSDLSNLKKELEELCSQTYCDYSGVQSILSALDRVMRVRGNSKTPKGDHSFDLL